MARGVAKNTAEQTAVGQSEEQVQTTVQLEGDDLMKLDEEDDDAGWVVVSKGHTLYHNGEKYQQFRRLKMDAGDAAPLLKNGVVVAYSDLLKQVSRNGD